MSSCWMVPTLKEGTHVNTVEAMQESFCKIIVDTLDGVIVQLRNKPEQIHTTYRILRENVDILTSGGCVWKEFNIQREEIWDWWSSKVLLEIDLVGSFILSTRSIFWAFVFHLILLLHGLCVIYMCLTVITTKTALETGHGDFMFTYRFRLRHWLWIGTSS